MSKVISKWTERGIPKPSVTLNYLQKLGFKKVHDYYISDGEKVELKELGINSNDFRLVDIAMSDGYCFLCSKAQKNEKEIKHLEIYKYKTSRKLPEKY